MLLATTGAMDTANEVVLRQEREAWLEEPKLFWINMQQGSKDEAAHSRPKRFRTKAEHWLIMVNSQLKAMTGFGLDRYAVNHTGEGPPRLPAANQQYLAISIDQGSDGWCATNFLLYGLRWAVIQHLDTSHRAWNDACNALKATSLWGLVLTQCVVMSLDHGPWSDGKWWHMGHEGVLAFMATAGVDDSVFASHVRPYHQETGHADTMHEHGTAQQCFDQLPDMWRRKLDKVGTTRWFGWWDATTQWLGVWHGRLCTL